MIVARDFYCMREQKKYKEGDPYTGSRKDLGNFLKMEVKEKPKKKKPRKRIPKKTEKK